MLKQEFKRCETFNLSRLDQLRAELGQKRGQDVDSTLDIKKMVKAEIRASLD
jgi:hypothetical protein